jgi:hypothetical protein
VTPAAARRPARRAPGRVAAPVLLVLAGCAAPRPPSGSGDEAARPAPVAVVAGERVSKAELCDRLRSRFREEWNAALEDLVDERLLLLEERRLPVSVPPAALSAAVDAEVEARRKLLTQRLGAAADLEASVRAWYGTDVAGWRRDVLAPRLAVHLRLQRLVRLDRRLRGEVVVRVIVSRDAPAAAAAREKVERGADFALVARESSSDASRDAGGLLAPIARGDLAVTAVEDALFGAAAGSLVGPLSVAGAAGPEVHLYRVVEARPPWTGAPSALASALEDDLARRPLSRAEYERWAASARRRHGVAYFAPDGSALPGPGSTR